MVNNEKVHSYESYLERTIVLQSVSDRFDIYVSVWSESSLTENLKKDSFFYYSLSARSPWRMGMDHERISISMDNEHIYEAAKTKRDKLISNLRHSQAKMIYDIS